MPGEGGIVYLASNLWKNYIFKKLNYGTNLRAQGIQLLGESESGSLCGHNSRCPNRSIPLSLTMAAENVKALFFFFFPLTLSYLLCDSCPVVTPG